MALYQYFQPSDGLPDPSGPLSASVSPAAIKDGNEAVRSRTRETWPTASPLITATAKGSTLLPSSRLHGNS